MREIIFELDAALYNDKTGEAVFKPKVIGEIVRCGNCKHRKNYSVCPLLCDDSWYNEDYGDNFFCALGEKK